MRGKKTRQSKIKGNREVIKERKKYKDKKLMDQRGKGEGRDEKNRLSQSERERDVGRRVEGKIEGTKR